LVTSDRPYELREIALTTANDLEPTAPVARHPVHAILAPVPLTCFVGAFLTDIVYWRTAEMMWADFSAWLLTVGVIIGVLAAIAGLIDLIGNRRRIRSQAPAWPPMLGYLVVLVLAFFNMLIHTRDAWTSVVPTGIVLSLITVLLLPFTGWLGWSVVYHHHRVGVAK
jgi:uncharacterized membrane protein